MQVLADPLLTAPRYRIADAARIVGRPGSTIRRWIPEPDEDLQRLNGQVSERKNGFQAQYSFLQVAEAVAVSAMRLKNVPLRQIRQSRECIRNQFDISHPFAIMHSGERGEKPGYRLIGCLDDDFAPAAANGAQTRAVPDLILPEFGDLADALFDLEPLPESGLSIVTRIYPRGKDSPLIANPKVRGGRVTIRGTTLTTDIVRGRVLSGDPLDLIADDFQITLEDIRAAVAFEAS